MCANNHSFDVKLCLALIWDHRKYDTIFFYYLNILARGREAIN